MIVWGQANGMPIKKNLVYGMMGAIASRTIETKMHK